MSPLPEQSGVMDRVADEEPLARFVLQSNWLHKADPRSIRVKPNAFLPHPLNSVAVSVYRIRDWSDQEIEAKGCGIGDERERNHRETMLGKGEPYPEGKRTFRHLGRAQLAASAVRVTGLDVVPKEPPLRHADIVGWPPPTGINRTEDEAAQLEYAQKLAGRCSFAAARS